MSSKVRRLHQAYVSFGALAVLAIACGDEKNENGGSQGSTNEAPAAGELAEGGAGSGGSDPSGTMASAGLWCDAFAVLRDACHTCHGAQPVGAPMSLASWEDTQATSTLDQSTPIYELIRQRIHDQAQPMPPVSQPPLTEGQKDILDAWLEAGVPSAEDPTCGLAEIEEQPDYQDMQWPADCDEHFKFTTSNGDGGPHLVRANTETHPKFDFDVPWEGAGGVQAVAFRPITDNPRVLHHWILYQDGNFLYGWAPGSQGLATGPDVGIYMPESGSLVLDMHYYNLGNPQDELDQSGVEVCITHAPRPHTATVFPFTAPATAPAGQRVENQDTCTVASSEPVYLIGSSPHMHQLGVHAKLEVLRTDGTTDVLHDAPFSFEDQLARPLPTVQLNNGDQVRTTCVFENQTTRNVTFGVGSDDEMCFNFALYYPMCGMRCEPTDLLSRIIAESQGSGCPTGRGGP